MLYFNPLSSHEMALMPENAVFTALLNLGALLVYSLVADALVQADRNVALQAENYTLSIENMQYRSLPRASKRRASPGTPCATISRSFKRCCKGRITSS